MANEGRLVIFDCLLWLSWLLVSF